MTRRDINTGLMIVILVEVFMIVMLTIWGQAKEPTPVEEVQQCEVTFTVTQTPASYEPAVVRYPVPLDDDLQEFIVRECGFQGVDPSIIFAMIDRESDFDIDAVGDRGKSFGLMQIQPRWHQARMDKLGVTDLMNPYQNVTVGVDYLAELLDSGKGIEWALMAYNGGMKYANELKAIGMVSDYAGEILATSERLKGGE